MEKQSRSTSTLGSLNSKLLSKNNTLLCCNSINQDLSMLPHVSASKRYRIMKVRAPRKKDVGPVQLATIKRILGNEFNPSELSMQILRTVGHLKKSRNPSPNRRHVTSLERRKKKHETINVPSLMLNQEDSPWKCTTPILRTPDSTPPHQTLDQINTIDEPKKTHITHSQKLHELISGLLYKSVTGRSFGPAFNKSLRQDPKLVPYHFSKLILEKRIKRSFNTGSVLCFDSKIAKQSGMPPTTIKIKLSERLPQIVHPCSKIILPRPHPLKDLKSADCEFSPWETKFSQDFQGNPSHQFLI